jgi:hypothetical protein
VGQIEKRTKFLLGGTVYEHTNQQPVLPPGSVRRFVLGSEPRIIAQVPLTGGGAVEVHGYATHYNPEWVTIVWNDDNYQQADCWVRASDVRRAGDGEWRGKYVAF